MAFAKARELGAAEKAIIFTESRKTQNYLLRLLGESSYADGIVLFNGTNTDDTSKAIYARWADRHQGTDKISGSKTADMRSALVDYFRKEGRIMIATEAGAEGINLQFCSLVVNYDLPWNPQRIEQRIGRCHRYGQKHDVVVVNFLNRKNEADLRVFQLLDEKFNLFTGVFGSSDEVLGAIEAGVDFEKRIAAIYQTCRKPDEIKAAFDQLQLEINFEINEAMASTRRKLLENFDDEVRDKLKVREETSKASLNRYESQLMQLTRHALNGYAQFHDDSTFELLTQPFEEKSGITLGLYELPRRSGLGHLYRLGHPLAERVITRAKERNLPVAEVEFRYSDYEGRISILEPLKGQSGWLTLSQFTVEALDQAEDHLIFAGCTDTGELLDEEQARRMFTLPGSVRPERVLSSPALSTLDAVKKNRQTEIERGVSERNALFFEAEAEKLDGWADDLKVGLEREIKEFDRLIKEARREAVAAASLEDKVAGQRKIKALEQQRGAKRRAIFEAQDQIDSQRGELIEEIEKKLTRRDSSHEVFCLKWRLL